MTSQIKLTEYSKGGGCGCKIAPSVLQQILNSEEKIEFEKLLVGNDSSDDAAVYEIDGNNCIISTTDFFLPIVDDAFDFGRIAAANAISDVYAMGGKPVMAIAILGWPIEKLPVEMAQQVLEGGRAVCKEAGIPLAGGHTIDSADPIFGLSVTGLVKKSNLKRNNTAKEGDVLFLTKALGSGILSTALKRNLLEGSHYTSLIKNLASLNTIGETLGAIDAVSAMTDVTGFGLLGHLIEMVEGSGMSAELYYNNIKKLDGLDEYLKAGVRPDATSRNWNSYSNKVKFEKGVNVMEAFNLLPDPQTNGGLLIAVSKNCLDEVQDLLRQNNLEPEPIGQITVKGEKIIYVK